jgi:hypothetical protein
MILPLLLISVYIAIVGYLAFRFIRWRRAVARDRREKLEAVAPKLAEEWRRLATPAREKAPLN